ncbi:MAG: SUMF1/EgtB/PvdO family nonheme iron enzyme, partial [Bdellovibrionales bacterium]|nr:SUMF1/EgtB/PvdO family nonheme iron enzyme [Bdellovibrionales bacterium]
MQKGAIVTVILIALVPCLVHSFEMQTIPSGTLTPFWVVPKSTVGKNKTKVSPYKVGSFKMMKYAVTKKDYLVFLNENPDWKKENIAGIYADSSYLRSFDNKPTKSPITEVSWFAARAFCENYGMRLPLLKEWEYAAAASETKKDANKEETFLRRILDWYGETKGKDMK